VVINRFAATVALAAILLLMLASGAPSGPPLAAEAVALPTALPPPDGARLVFPLVYQQPVPEIAYFCTSVGALLFGPAGDLCVASSNGALQANLTHNGEHVMSLEPAWSPDGTLLAYTHYAAGDHDIRVVDWATGEVSNLTGTPDAGETSPAWSPDGTRIAYVRGDDICVMGADGGSPLRLTTTPGSDYIPAWSPDGASISFLSDRDGTTGPYVMEADGTSQRRVAPGDGAFAGRAAAWSPDGRRVAFLARIRRQDGLYVADVDGDTATLVATGAAAGSPAAWSPDGEWIACVLCDPESYCGMMIVHPDGADPRALGGGSAPTWSPDSRWLAYTGSGPDGGTRVWVTNLDGSVRRPVSRSPWPDHLDPIWRP